LPAVLRASLGTAPTITQAALDTLGTNDPLVLRLGGAIPAADQQLLDGRLQTHSHFGR
jgi:hypothetical protein